MLQNLVDVSVLYRRVALPFSLAFVLFFAIAPIAFASTHDQTVSLVGPKKTYLALGDSLAFGYQPDLDFRHGYADDFYQELRGHGVTSMVNLGCPGETSATMIQGNCPLPLLRKYPYIGSQLNAALLYLNTHRGQVSPVTFNIGSNDLIPAINPKTCEINVDEFNAILPVLDENLTQVILPQLRNALMVDGKVTGDLVMMNYYDPFQNQCPQTVPFIQQINQHLVNDAQGYGVVVNSFEAFGGSVTPNTNICTYTWMCSPFKDIHATDLGYSAIATMFEKTTGY